MDVERLLLGQTRLLANANIAVSYKIIGSVFVALKTLIYGTLTFSGP